VLVPSQVNVGQWSYPSDFHLLVSFIVFVNKMFCRFLLWFCTYFFFIYLGPSRGDCVEWVYSSFIEVFTVFFNSNFLLVFLKKIYWWRVGDCLFGIYHISVLFKISHWLEIYTYSSFTKTLIAVSLQSSSLAKGYDPLYSFSPLASLDGFSRSHADGLYVMQLVVAATNQNGLYKKHMFCRKNVNNIKMRKIASPARFW
jgi:hypothetical protein